MEDNGERNAIPAASCSSTVPLQVAHRRPWASPACVKIALPATTLGGFAATSDGDATGFPS